MVHFRSGSLGVGFTWGRVISDVGHFGCGSISGFVRLWIDLRRVFGSKSVQPISGVGSGMDPGQSVGVSGFGSVLPGLFMNICPDSCLFIEDLISTVPSPSEQAKHDEVDKDSKLLSAKIPRSQTTAPWNSLSMLASM